MFRLARAALPCLLSACATPQRPADEPSPLTQSPASQRLAPLRQRISGMLPGARPEEWKRLGPDALIVLQQIVNDPATYPEQRAQALRALPLADSPDARGVLEAYARDAHQDPATRAGALDATLSLPPPPDNTLGRGMLDDPAPPVRAAAARVVAKLGGAGAREALEARLEKEEDAAVRQEVQRGLTALQP